MEVNFILLLIAGLGILSNNISLLISGIVLFVLKNLQLFSLLDFVDNYSAQVGIFLIMLGVLAPIASGELDLAAFKEQIFSLSSLLAVGMGIAVTQFTREGLVLLQSEPAVTVNLVIGIILGVAFFRGVPSGPLIAGGITAVIYKFLSFFL